MSKKEHINVIWLKRDLRLQDNEAMTNALKTDKRAIILYVFEHILLQDGHYSMRHFNFIKESLKDINKQLDTYNSKVLVVTSDITSAFNQLQSIYNIDSVFSHVETGLLITYNRDKEFTRYCRNNLIKWTESKNNGVMRGLTNRDSWFEKWETYMHQDLEVFQPKENQLLNVSEIQVLEQIFTVTDLETPSKTSFQKGGSEMGWKYANSFFEGRHVDYMFNISKPEASRSSCSRISPYIAWGNLSIRQVFQKGKVVKGKTKDKRHISAFLSRLRWQAHFIQKFEMEHTMEEASVNKGYHKLKKAYQKTIKKHGKKEELVSFGRCKYPMSYRNRVR